MAQVITRTRRYFTLIKEALRGEEKVYTEGSINRALVLLAVPMILEMTMESMFALVDAYFVGHLGKGAISVVGLTESVLAIIYAVAVGISTATTAIVARRIGEKNPEGASIAAMQSIYLAFGFSVIVSIAGIIYAADILRLMGAGEEMVAYGHGFTRIALGSNIVIMMLFLINGIFRGAGEASIAMRSLWLANILNIILCPICIYGFGPVPAMGIEGAAIATTIGRGTGVVYQCYHLFGGKKVIRIRWEHIRPHWETVRKLASIATGGTMQFLISSASWIFLTLIISHFGVDALDGYTFAIRAIIFAILPAWGLANAAATLVGQNLGANEPERAAISVKKAAIMNMVFLGSVSVFFITLAPWIIGFFSADPAVQANGVEGLRIVSVGYLFYAFGMVMIQAFNGAGDTRTPTIINLLGFWVFQIPLAYLLAIVLDWGPQGVYWAIVMAESAMAVAGVILFRRGRWKKIKV